MTKPHYRRTADGQLLPAIRAADGFQNLVANLGTSRDKASASGYVVTELNDADLDAAYRASSVAEKIVDMPAEDSCREWRAWQAEAEQIEKLEAEEKRLGIIGKVMEARKLARLFGGAAIYIGTADSNPATPLNQERVREGGLRYLSVLTRSELTADELQLDPRQPGFGRPIMYRMTAGNEAMVAIHPSRLAVFRGKTFLGIQNRQAHSGWGDSVLTSTLEKVKHLDATVANVASLVFEAKVDVIGIKDFTMGLRDGGAAYEQLMLRRFGLAMTGKGINGTLMLDSEEEYDQKTASFSQLPELIDRFMQVVSAAAEIPMTRLFGMSPAGMNATGENDLRNYYDQVRKEQTLEMEPAMEVLDECLIRSALGDRPKEVHFNWRSLWQISEGERAEIGTKLTTAAETAIRTEAIPAEVMGEALVNALTEVGVFPGLEAAMDGYTAPTERTEVDPLTGDPMEAADAAPRTLYVRRDVLNAAEIIAWAKDQGFKSTLPADDMHVTIAFSREAVDWMKVGQSWEDEVKVSAGGPRLMERFGEARVMLFASSALSWRHEEIKLAGATWDHPEYQPHITISYDPESPDITEVKPYTGAIMLGPEIFEEVNEKWMEGVKEE